MSRAVIARSPPRPVADDEAISMTLLRWATATLEEAGVPRPRWNAEQLLSSALGVEPISLFLERPVVGTEEAARFRRAVALRADRMPLQYLLGSAAFYGREFAVGPGVFIPRPETEILIDVALKRLKMSSSRKRGSGPRLRGDDFVDSHWSLPSTPIPDQVGDDIEGGNDRVVVDVGTGSGAIAITLALEYPKAFYVGVDPSSAALSFARRNASRHHVAIAFFQADLAEIFQRRSLDLIVANLPYLDAAASSQWPIELAWEPWMSLGAGSGGLSCIEKLIGQAKRCLRPGGHLVMEIGDGQGEALRRAPRPAWRRNRRGGQGERAFQLEEIVPDLSGKERVVVLRKR